MFPHRFHSCVRKDTKTLTITLKPFQQHRWEKKDFHQNFNSLILMGN